jgi:ABC-type transport system involved in multi-copper enzyme maturation permease subunit
LWPHKATILFGAIPLGNSKKPSELVYYITYYGVSLVGAPVIMLLSCIITAFYIPNMLRKGTIDMLLAKPINRIALLLFKYMGGLTFMFVNTALLIFGLWIALGLRSGIWEPVFLINIPVITFEFAFFYAVSTLAAIVTRSPIVSILLCILTWFILSAVGWAHAGANALKGPDGGEGLVTGWLATSADVIHTVFPHYLDLGWVSDRALEERSLAMTTAEREHMAKRYEKYTWGESILITGLYIAAFLAVSCWWFASKDY